MTVENRPISRSKSPQVAVVHMHLDPRPNCSAPPSDTKGRKRTSYCVHMISNWAVTTGLSNKRNLCCSSHPRLSGQGDVALKRSIAGGANGKSD